MYRLVLAAVAMVGSLPAFAYNCPSVLRMNFGSVVLAMPLPDREYDRHVPEKAATVERLANSNQIFSFALKNVQGSTTKCEYVDESDHVWFTIRTTSKRAYLKFDRAFSTETKNKRLSIFQNRLVADVQMPRKEWEGKSEVTLTGVQFKSEFEYYYSCGFLDCSDQGYEPVPLAAIKRIHIQIE